MAEPLSGPPRGLWNERVRIARPGGFAFRPGEVLVRREVADLAARTLQDAYGQRKADQPIEQDPVGDDFVRFTGIPDPVEAIDTLHRVGVLAQVNHVVFSHCCCPPHPASALAESFYASPYYANVVSANPYYANPYYANPYYANLWGPDGICCSSCSGSVGANPYYANPYYANADPSPFESPEFAETGRRRSSARPAEPPGTAPGNGRADVRITILDTGYAEDAYAPGGLPGMRFGHRDRDAPDEVGDGFLDPAAGHGTFIAGVIEQVAPGCELELIRALGTYGDGDEAFIVTTLEKLAQRTDGERPHFVNLSFGAYAPLGMGALAHAIAKLQAAGTVVIASAGNDATCVPMYPAALPDVVGVAALDGDGDPALFTNYGLWVRVCTFGVDAVSIFFDNFNGAEPPVDGVDPDHFEGWATWSGTSFAAPRVAAALARHVIDQGVSPQDAVTQLVDAPELTRKPMLGTVVP